MSKQFGDRLKELRTEKRMTQEELAKLFNTGKASISNYEKNARLPDANTISRYADYFNVSIDYIMGKTDNKTTKLVTKSELPKELIDIGVEFMTIAKDAQMSDINPEDLKNLVDILKRAKSK